MRRQIVIFDKKQGIAKDGRMPWYLPTDFKHFKELTSTASRIMLMTGPTFRNIGRPLPGRENVVWTRDGSLARKGVKIISDPAEFLKNTPDVWIIGGTKLFEQTLDISDELYITRIDHDFNCDRFFPQFEDKFILKDRGEELSENGFTFHFEKWVKKSSNTD